MGEYSFTNRESLEANNYVFQAKASMIAHSATVSGNNASRSWGLLRSCNQIWFAASLQKEYRGVDMLAALHATHPSLVGCYKDLHKTPRHPTMGQAETLGRVWAVPETEPAYRFSEYMCVASDHLAHWKAQKQLKDCGAADTQHNYVAIAIAEKVPLKFPGQFSMTQFARNFRNCPDFFAENIAGTQAGTQAGNDGAEQANNQAVNVGARQQEEAPAADLGLSLFPELSNYTDELLSTMMTILDDREKLKDPSEKAPVLNPTSLGALVGLIHFGHMSDSFILDTCRTHLFWDSCRTHLFQTLVGLIYFGHWSDSFILDTCRTYLF